MTSVSLFCLLSVSVSWTNWVRRLGGPGLLILGVLDGSMVPTFGTLDQFAGILAARQQPLWFYFAAMSTIGAMIGAFTTYRLGREAGSEWLAKKFGAQRSLRARRLIERWGFGALLVTALAPPPFPASVLFFAAGSLNYRTTKYISAVMLGKAIRYGAITYVVSHYRLYRLRSVFHTSKYWVESLLVTLTIIVALEFVVLLLGTRKTAARHWRRANVIPNANPLDNVIET